MMRINYNAYARRIGHFITKPSAALLCSSISIAVMWWGADFILAYQFRGIKTDLMHSLPVLGLLWISGLLLCLTRSRVFAGVFTVCLTLMSLIQLNHIAYFGTAINPVEIGRLAAELPEIMQTGFGMISHLWPVTALVLLNGWLTWRLSRLEALRAVRLRGVPLVIMLLLAYNPWRLSHKHIAAYTSDAFDHTFHNSLNGFSYWLLAMLKGETVDLSHLYKPYSARYTPVTKPVTVILIMGESCNPNHFSLYGYHRDTTPKLCARKNDPAFAYARGISGALSTGAALQLFFNQMREPANLAVMEKRTVNLWHLAKKQGFNTMLISAQERKVAHDCGVEAAQTCIFRDQPEGRVFDQEGDDGLLTLLKQQTLGERNFIVLHQRAVHSPYDVHYADKPVCKVYGDTKDAATASDALKPGDADTDCRRLMTDTYDNAVRSVDMLWDEIIAYAKTLPGQVYVFFTSDHGELLGEKGLWGHNIMELETALVPMWVYSKDRCVTDKIRSRPYMSHYDLGMVISEVLGVSVTNANNTPGVSYIHGNNIYEAYNYLEVNFKNGRPQVKEPLNVGDTRGSGE